MTSQFKKESPGTVLLRQAAPKYKYSARKLPKQRSEVDEQTKMSLGQEMERGISPSSSTSSVGSKLEINTNSAEIKRQPNPLTPISMPSPSQNITSQGTKPVAVVGASIKNQNKKPSALDNSINTNQLTASSYSVSNSSAASNHFNQLTTSSTTYSDKEQNSINSSTSRLPMQTTKPIPSSYNAQSQAISSTVSVPPNNGNKFTTDDVFSLEDAAMLIDNSASAAALSGVTNEMLSKRLAEVEKERDKLQKDLDSQLQVNSELKRLLVASVGDDLSKRVERLAEDRVQLSMDIGGFSKKMTEDYENLDKMSIQADMWRSKYLASRVMVEELGNARAYFSLQWHESQDALQQMLNERHELRTNLLETYKTLQQVKDAFDPLNSHRSSSLSSTNVLSLSRGCQQLGEAVRFRLLPAHVSMPTFSIDAELDLWANSVTKAEQYAHELLSRPSEPIGSLQSTGPSNVLPIVRSPSSPHINRYHPHMKHENFYVHCLKCKGEIHVV